MTALNIIFFGTPDICINGLDLLKNHPEVNLILVVTMPDRPKGRGRQIQSPEVALWAKENTIKCLQTENINNDAQFAEQMKSIKVDLIIVFAFSQFLGKKILQYPSIGCFNIHTSLLPKYRGAAPIQYALLNGDPETGVSIQKMVKKMDAGDIVLSASCKITPEENALTLYDKLKKLSAKILDTFIDQSISNSLNYTPQDESLVTIAPTIKKTDGFINFKKNKSHRIINKTKAFNPWPGTYCFINHKRVKILKLETDSQKIPAGEISTEFGTLSIGTESGSLRICQLQVEGKKACSDSEYLNGLRSSDLEINLTEAK